MSGRRERDTLAASSPAPAFGPDGLVPAIVQDVADGRVLMLGYMDSEALTATVSTGEVHFHSRSRARLWRKGETSGNVLRVVDLALDCDADALLVTVEPAGPTCHRGTRSCFDGSSASGAAPRADDPRARGLPLDGPQGFAWLERLWATIAARAADRPAGSYTAALLEGGVDAVGRKVTEEATEVLLAARDDAETERREVASASIEARTPQRDAVRAALAGESADLLYHLLVLLAERRLEPSRVMEVLRERHRA